MSTHGSQKSYFVHRTKTRPHDHSSSTPRGHLDSEIAILQESGSGFGQWGRSTETAQKQLFRLNSLNQGIISLSGYPTMLLRYMEQMYICVASHNHLSKYYHQDENDWWYFAVILGLSRQLSSARHFRKMDTRNST